MFKRQYTIDIEDIQVEVIHKKIKHFHIHVYPPEGKVIVSAPLWASKNEVRLAVSSRIGWIQHRQANLINHTPHSKWQLITGEYHPFQGKSYLIQVIERLDTPEIYLEKDTTMVIAIRPQTDRNKRIDLLFNWYRNQIKALIPPLIAKWEPILGVEVAEWRVRRMKTRWGTCNIEAHRIWLNLELIKKSPECLDYVVLHEMVHLLERRHNKRFYAYLDRFMPEWRNYRAELKQTSLEFEFWAYS